MNERRNDAKYDKKRMLNGNWMDDIDMHTQYTATEYIQNMNAQAGLVT